MSSITRRDVLASAPLVCVGGIAGCSSRSTQTSSTNRSTLKTSSPTTQSKSTQLHETLEDRTLPAGGNWPTYRYDNRNSLHTPGASGVPESPTPYWRIKNDLIPIISGGSLYTRISEYGIVACDAKTGIIEWSTDVKGGSQSLTIADGNIVLTTITDAYSFDISTGSLTWSQGLQTGKSSAPRFVDKMVYFCKDTYGSTPSELHVLKSDTGQHEWSEKIEGEIGGTVAVTQETVYVTAADLYAFDGKSGTKRWTFSTQKPIGTAPVVANDRVYAVDEDGIVFAVHTEEGDRAWQAEVGSSPRIGGLAVTEATVYYCGQDGLHALDSRTGEERWHFETQSRAAAPTVTDGVVYFGTDIEERNLRAVDAESGEEYWSYQFPLVMKEGSYYGGIYTAPLVVDDAIYVCGNDGYLYALGKSEEFSIRSSSPR